MDLILDSFEKAFKSLNKAVDLMRQQDPEDKDLVDALRDSVVQRFEYTYELAFKFIKRQLKTMSANPQEIDSMDFRDVLRSAGEAGLVANVQAFYRYRLARNITSHTYDEDKAEEVLEVVPDFISDARALLEKLRDLNKPAHD